MLKIMNVKCPHCLNSLYIDKINEDEIGTDCDGVWWLVSYQCPSCQKYVIRLILMKITGGITSGNVKPLINQQLVIRDDIVYPKLSNRPPCSTDVPKDYSVDYCEACDVLNVSPKASAALSRRCLQLFIQNELLISHNNLNREIDEVIDKNIFPSHISDLMHSLQWLGNFGAHPLKNTNTGLIIDVDLGEAELCLEILEAIFDFYYVLPKKNADRKAKINAKLVSAGKPQLK